MVCVRMPPAVARALAFDPSQLAPAAAIRSALGVTTPLVIGAAAGHPADGAIAAVGALPVGVAAMTGDLPVAPVGLLVATTIGMAASTFVGSLCSGHVAAVVITLALWGFVAGLMVALGRAATVTGVQALIGLIVFGRYPGGMGTAALHAGWVLAGGLMQTLFAVVLRPPRRHGPERQAIADLYQRLAALALGTTYGGPSGAAHAAATTVLTMRGSEQAELRGLVDEGARIRLELQALQSVSDIPGVEDLTGAAAGRLRRLSRAVLRGTPVEAETPDLAGAVDVLRHTHAAEGRAGTSQRFAAARAAALLGQLRAAERLADALSGARWVALPRIAGVTARLQLGSSFAGGVTRLREAARDVDAPAFRHAVRLAVLLPVAEIVSRQLPWQRGYWVPLTTVVILKPDYAATVQRGVARLVGTGLGIVVAGVLVAEARPTGLGLIVAAALAAWSSYTVFAASYALYTFALTALIVFLISTGDPRPLAAVADRGLDTLLGGAIALLGYAAWPTPEERTLRSTTAQLLDSLGDYADAVLGGYVGGRYDAELRTRATERARAARRAREEAQASLDRALAEPARLRPDTTVAQSVLAGARREVITLHALRTTLQDTAEHIALPEVAPVATEVVSALHELATAVREHRDPLLPALREGQHRIEQTADEAGGGSLRGRRLGVVAAHLDPLVDAIDTIAHVLDGEMAV